MARIGDFYTDPQELLQNWATFIKQCPMQEILCSIRPITDSNFLYLYIFFYLLIPSFSSSLTPYSLIIRFTTLLSSILVCSNNLLLWALIYLLLLILHNWSLFPYLFTFFTAYSNLSLLQKSFP